MEKEAEELEAGQVQTPEAEAERKAFARKEEAGVWHPRRYFYLQKEGWLEDWPYRYYTLWGAICVFTHSGTEWIIPLIDLVLVTISVAVCVGFHGIRAVRDNLFKIA